MTASTLLKISAGICLLFALGHLAGGLRQWSPMGPNKVLTEMTDVRFDTMGANRSYLDFFLGFGWSIGVTMVMEAVVLWLLAAIAPAQPDLVRPVIAVIALATAINGVIAWRYIFPVPALFSVALVLPLVGAYFKAR